jgi:predicted DNA-binding transcriptional regulator YafY
MDQTTNKAPAINRYILIINFIRAHKNRSSFEAISRYLSEYADENELHVNNSRSTFIRDIKTILEIFGIDITYNRQQNSYYIADGNDFQDNLQHRMLDTLNMFNILKARDALADYVQFEVRKLSGTEHFHDLLTAIKNKKMVKFTYFNFHNQEYRGLRFHPLYLKEARNRWYIIGCEDGADIIQSIGLDRISELEITKKHRIQPKAFNISEHYRYCMGASDLPRLKPEKVRLSFGKFQGQYLKTYPLHHTQKVTETEDEIIVELEIKLTPDFIMELLSYGDTMKVLAPQKLTDELIKTHEHSLQVLKGTTNEYLIAKEY